jgi:acyl transferase domain-containing protein
VGERLGRVGHRILLCVQGSAASSACVCGVSSFGYSGTIAHAVAAADALAAVDGPSSTSGGSAAAAWPPFAYRRRACAWRASPHPFAQRLLPASAEGGVAFCSSASGALGRLVADHVVQGRIIFPGAGYLEMARASAAALAAGAGMRSVFFLVPLAVETSQLLVEFAVSNGRFEVRSRVDDDGVEDDVVSVHCAGLLASDSHAEEQRAGLAHARVWACAVAVSVVALYDGFDASGLQYGPQYRTLASAWGGVGASLAQLRARATHEGTLVHPADLDDALCAGAAAGDGGDGGGRAGGGDEAQLPFAIDDAQLNGAQGELWAVRMTPSRWHGLLPALSLLRASSSRPMLRMHPVCADSLAGLRSRC